jgi:hypothetical protein
MSSGRCQQRTVALWVVLLSLSAIRCDQSTQIRYRREVLLDSKERAFCWNFRANGYHSGNTDLSRSRVLSVQTSQYCRTVGHCFRFVTLSAVEYRSVTPWPYIPEFQPNYKTCTIKGARGCIEFQAVRYKPGGRGFETRRITLIPAIHLTISAH